MHTFESNNGTKFNHNGDFSGDVTICTSEQTFKISCESLFEFVSEFVKQEKISKIEKASYSELLGL